jgi:Protein of unknown function (DUF1552)
MTRRSGPISRRMVLRGLGGVVVGLPALDIFMERDARAAGAGGDFAVFVVNCNGVQQAHGPSIFGAPGHEAETFWPSAAPGSITQSTLGADLGKRTLGELGPHAERLLVVKGITHAFGSVGCAHNGGDGQILTAAHPIKGKSFDVCDGESIDNRIGTEKNPPGREPLALRAGKFSADATGFEYPGHVSYRGPSQPRAAEASPLAAYQRMVGMDATSLGPSTGTGTSERRTSVNDLVRTQMKRLLMRTDLSAADRQRLDQHFTAIRDMEIKISGQLPPDKVTAIKNASVDPLDPAHHDEVLSLQLDLLVFAISSGYTRAATFKIGDRIDRAIWTVDGGTVLPEFHMISHRILADGAHGPLIDGAVGMHHKIDVIHAKKIKYLLDQLAAVDTPQGKLLDQGYVAWTNQVAVGSHDYYPIPWVIAGSGKGYLKTGQYLDVGKVTGNKILNTLLGAAGVKKANGDPVDDFGAKQTAGGVISALIA